MEEEFTDFNDLFKSLVLKAQQGEDHRNNLCAFLLPHVERLTQNLVKFRPDLREDVVQESLIALMGANLENVPFPKAYMATVIRRTSMRLCEKNQFHNELNGSELDDRDDLTTFENLELMDRLAEVIDNMKSRCRRILNMFTFKADLVNSRLNIFDPNQSYWIR